MFTGSVQYNEVAVVVAFCMDYEGMDYEVHWESNLVAG